jgi:hypothetical protein
MEIWRVWVWSDIHTDGYFREHGTADVYGHGSGIGIPSKPAPFPSYMPTYLEWIDYRRNSCGEKQENTTPT